MLTTNHIACCSSFVPSFPVHCDLPRTYLHRGCVRGANVFHTKEALIVLTLSWVVLKWIAVNPLKEKDETKAQ
jgi:hypothetical protein